MGRMTAYDEGYTMGQYRRDVPCDICGEAHYDPRWDFADAAKQGVFDEFKRGFEDGFDGKEPTP
jgi:hypothetical protein